MAEELQETTHFGLTRLGPGEALSKNGYSFSDLDRTKLDRLLWAALTHRHDGGVALGDPTIEPTMTPHPTGGHLPAATTYYYRISYVDEHGLETAASPEGSVDTPDPIGPPTAFSGTVELTGGTVIPGIYSYMITYTDAYGGETTPSAINNVQVTGGTTNRIRLDLPDLPTDATGYAIYRARPGQSAFYQVATVASPTTVLYDTALIEDQTVQAPTINTTSAANSIDVTIPEAFIPLGCVSWRIYRATSSGGYDGYSLVHEVTEGVTETSTVPLTVWTDTGDVLLQGFPLESSSTVPSGQVLTLNQVAGSLSLSVVPRGSQMLNAYCAGTPSNGRVITVTETPNGMSPVRFTAYFQTPPTDSGVTVTFHAEDDTGTFVELPCSPSTHQSGDNAGFFHVEYPLISAASYEAEDGTRSSTTTVTIEDDPSTPSGQAVQLNGINEYIQADLGQLDAGSYHSWATVRVVAYPTSGTPTNDLEISVVRMDTNATVGTPVQYTLTDTSVTGYVEYTGPNFTAPGGVDLVLRVKKTTSVLNTYNVDKMRFTADVPTLDAGTLTVTSIVTGGTTSSADANISLWF